MSSTFKKVKTAVKKTVDATVQIATLGQLDLEGAEKLVDDFSGETAAKEANRRADSQRDQDMMQLNEELRRTELSDKQRVGRARALAGASGAKFTGSIANYAEELSKTFSVQRDWMRRAGTSSAEQRRRATSEAGRSAKRGRRVSIATQGFSSLAGK